MREFTRVGPCCSCGEIWNVRTLVLLNRRTPRPGLGWGCSVCNLANDGAIAVLCDYCVKQGWEAVQAVVGPLGSTQRTPVVSLPAWPGHDEQKHAEYERWLWGLTDLEENAAGNK
jgi:hypothetical protein